MTRRTFAPVAVAFSSSVLVSVLAAPAAAEEWFDNGEIHFSVDADLHVTSTTVRAPEGPVDVVTITPSSGTMAGDAGTSFISLTVFRAALPGEGEQTEVARDLIVDGVRAALRGAQVEVEERAISLAGQPVDGVRLSIVHGGARASATAGAVAVGDTVVVYYDQRSSNDAAWFESLNRVAETFAFGPVPVTGSADEDDAEHADEHAAPSH